jgi:phosphoglycerate kinase
MLIIMAHQGRPKDAPDPTFSQKPLVPVLEKLLGTTVHFAEDCVGEKAESAVKQAKMGDIVLLENLRFHPEEKKNDPAFAKALASLGDMYVNDAFTNCHRSHASMVGVPTLLPSYMGLQLEQEVDHLLRVMKSPMHPLTLIIGGAKLETKVPIIRNFLPLADHILVGGAVGNTFVAAQGIPVGKSKYDAEGVSQAKELLEESMKEGSATLGVPTDAFVATSPEDGANGKNMSFDAAGETLGGDGGEGSFFDIGTKTAEAYALIIKNSKMIIWNGPVGLSENEAFSKGSKTLCHAVQEATKNGAVSIIGGGDTIDFHNRYDIPLDAYTFVSMGGQGYSRHLHSYFYAL